MCRRGTAECDSCVFVDRCEPLSLARRQALHEKFGVAAKPATPRKSKAKAPAAKPALVSVKARDLVDKIEATGLAVGDSLRKGVNPFNKPAFLKVACHICLKRPEGFDQDLLAAAFMHKLDWDRPLALAQSQLAIEALTALGVLENHNSRHRVRA